MDRQPLAQQKGPSLAKGIELDGSIIFYGSQQRTPPGEGWGRDRLCGVSGSPWSWRHWPPSAMQLQLGVHGRQSHAHCQPPSGLRQRAQRLRQRPLQPLLPAGRRNWHTGRAERGLSLRTAAESGFGLTRQAGRDWLQNMLSRFGPMNDRASNAHVLDFERPLVELDNRIKEVLPCPALNNKPLRMLGRLWHVLPAA